MEIKNMFDEAFAIMESSAVYSDDTEFGDAIKARAAKVTDTSGIIGVYGPVTYDEPRVEKRHRVLGIVGGLVGTAAVLVCGFFGVRFVIENGGLKGPDVRGAGAGPAATSETEPPYTMPAREGEEFIPPATNIIDPETLPDISEAIGKQIEFHDAIVQLSRVDYDGETFSADFNLLYTGDDYENYSPDYVMIDIGYTLNNGEVEYITADDSFSFSIKEVPEADSFTHRCNYSVPVKLEAGKAYSVSIIYLNSNCEGSNGSSTQGIEADKQRYKFVYKPFLSFWFGNEDDNVYEFEKCRLKVTDHSFDGATLDLKYIVEFKNRAVAEEPDFGLTITASEACVMDSGIPELEKSGKGAYVHLRIMLIGITHDCSVTFSENGKAYTYMASKPDDINILQFEIGSPEDNRVGIYPAFLNVTPSAVCVTYYGGDENTFIAPEDLTVYFDDGTELEGEYLSQIYNHSDYKICTNVTRYNIPTCDPAHIKSIYLGTECIYEKAEEKYFLDDLRGLALAEAIRLLSEKHIKYEIIETQSDDAPEGTIIRTEPMNGQVVDPSETVKLFVSTGSEYSSDLLVTKIDRLVAFDGIEVNFKDCYFDKTVLKLHYDVIFPQGVPNDAATGIDRVETELGSIVRDYSKNMKRVTAQTADSLSFEQVYYLYDPQNEITVTFVDTISDNEDKLPFVIKAGDEALTNETRCPEPYDFKVNVNGIPRAELASISLYPSAIRTEYRLYRSNDADPVLEIIGKADTMRVLRRYGEAVKTEQSILRSLGDSVVVITPLAEVTAISHIDAIYIDEQLVWDRSSPEGGIVGTTVSIDP